MHPLAHSPSYSGTSAAAPLPLASPAAAAPTAPAAAVAPPPPPRCRGLPAAAALPLPFFLAAVSRVGFWVTRREQELLNEGRSRSAHIQCSCCPSTEQLSNCSTMARRSAAPCCTPTCTYRPTSALHLCCTSCMHTAPPPNKLLTCGAHGGRRLASRHARVNGVQLSFTELGSIGGQREVEHGSAARCRWGRSWLQGAVGWVHGWFHV